MFDTLHSFSRAILHSFRGIYIWCKRGCIATATNLELHEAGKECWVLHSNRLTDSNAHTSLQRLVSQNEHFHLKSTPCANVWTTAKGSTRITLRALLHKPWLASTRLRGQPFFGQCVISIYMTSGANPGQHFLPGNPSRDPGWSTEVP